MGNEVIAMKRSMVNEPYAIPLTVDQLISVIVVIEAICTLSAL